VDSQIILTNQKNPRDINLPKSGLYKTMISVPMTLDLPKTNAEKNAELFEAYIEPNDQQRSLSGKRKIINERRKSPNTLNLSFIHAKESFHQDKDSVMGMESFHQDRDAVMGIKDV
jgi:hypothetical protein